LFALARPFAAEFEPTNSVKTEVFLFKEFVAPIVPRRPKSGNVSELR